MIKLSLHREEVEILRRRYREFLIASRMALENELYDLACFLAEQALQLYMKSLLLELVGEYPRTHSIRRLLGELNRILSSEKINEFTWSNRARISMLEDAYYMARYHVKEYTREDAEDMVKLVEEAVRLIEDVRGSRS